MENEMDNVGTLEVGDIYINNFFYTKAHVVYFSFIVEQQRSQDFVNHIQFNIVDNQFKSVFKGSLYRNIKDNTSQPKIFKVIK